jgi:hypothetical protein
MAQILAPKTRGVSSATDKPDVHIEVLHQHLIASSSHSEQLFPRQNKTLNVVHVTIMDCGNIPARILVGGSPSANGLICPDFVHTFVIITS